MEPTEAGTELCPSHHVTGGLYGEEILPPISCSPFKVVGGEVDLVSLHTLGQLELPFNGADPILRFKRILRSIEGGRLSPLKIS